MSNERFELFFYKMKTFIPVLLVSIVLTSCSQVSKIVPTETAMPTQTITSVLPTPTATFWVTPQVTATPLNITLDANTIINEVIEQLHPEICTGHNLAILTPPPIDVPAPTPLEFIEVDNPPDPYSYYFSAIADNIDKSLQAFIACEPEQCHETVYIKDNKTGTVYEIYFGGLSYRPISWLTWLNKDSLLFAQSSNPHYGRVIVINYETKEYLYYGMATDDCLSFTPTP